MRNPKPSDHEQKSIDKPDYQFILNQNLSYETASVPWTKISVIITDETSRAFYVAGKDNRRLNILSATSTSY